MTKRIHHFFGSNRPSPKIPQSPVKNDTSQTFNLESPTTVAPKKPTVDLFDVGGNQEMLSSLADFVRYLKNPDKFNALGAHMPKGVILSGPPGVGKTYLAEAIAGHAGVPLYQVSASSLQDTILGGTEKNLRAVFEAANKHAPCVLCIDEIDSLGQKRFDKPSQGCEQSLNSVVNQLLTLLADANEKVVIIGTTNNFDTLDPALVRPGRFDRHIVVNKPDLKAREQIIAIHCKNKPIDHSLMLSSIAEETEGFSGADIASLVNEAALNAARHGKTAIDMSDFDQARIMVKEGMNGTPISNELQKWRTAVHEASHAMVAHILQHTIYKVTVLQYGNKLGHTEIINHETENFTRERLLNEICICLAGRAGEIIKETPQCGSFSDIEKAKTLAKMIIEEGLNNHLVGTISEDEIEALLDTQMQRAVKLIQENSAAWDSVLKGLIKYDELMHDDFISLVNHHDINMHRAHETMDEANDIIPISSKNDMSQSLFSKPKETAPNLPFTLDQIAIALHIDPSKIRKTQMNLAGNFEIRLKPSFNDENLIKAIQVELQSNDVEHFYYDRKLEIYADGMADFIQLVNRKLADADPSNASQYKIS